jgi:hypothetical protein
MIRIELDKQHPCYILQAKYFKGWLNWQGNSEGHAMVSLSLDNGMRCQLHISRDLKGSIFEFRVGEQLVSLALDAMCVMNHDISRMEFVIESSEMIEAKVLN